jgi:hypothetical protein
MVTPSLPGEESSKMVGSTMVAIIPSPLKLQ